MGDLIPGFDIGGFFEGLWEIFTGVKDLVVDIFSEVHSFFGYFLKILEVVQSILVLLVVYQGMRLLESTLIPFVGFVAKNVIVPLFRWCGCLCCRGSEDVEEFTLDEKK
jgi:hypothetical protein